jgi:hypothetical protein
MAYAKGKFAQSISDRSGQAFPYKEMVKEWNGSWVHTSEFEAKHPQLDPKYHRADPQAIWNARAQRFQQPEIVSGVRADSGGRPVGVANLTLPGDFAYLSTGMQPENGSLQNRRRQLTSLINRVTVVIS